MGGLFGLEQTSGDSGFGVSEKIDTTSSVLALEVTGGVHITRTKKVGDWNEEFDKGRLGVRIDGGRIRPGMTGEVEVGEWDTGWKKSIFFERRGHGERQKVETR